MKLDDEVPAGELAERDAIAATLHRLLRGRDAAHRPEPRAFLAWATQHVPFYRRWRAGAPGAGFAQLPLTTRAQLAARPDDFVAEPLKILPGYFGRQTSGTTDRPLFVRFDPACWYDYHYASHAAFMAACPEARRRVRPGAVAIVLVTDKPRPQGQRLTAELPSLGARFRQLAIGRSAREDAAVVRALRRDPVPLLHGVAVTLVRLAELDAAIPGAPIRPGGIVVSGTNLFADDRAHLERWFGCRVIDAYTSTEGGLIALECPHRTGLHVRPGRRLELLRPDGTLARRGTGEVVLSNLDNRAMIFLRYRTGDVATVDDRHRCRCGHRGATITELPAREATHLRVPGRPPVPARAIEQALLALPMIRRFQLCQVRPDRVVLRWEPRPGAAADPRAIRRVLAELLGPIAVTARRAAPLFGPGAKHARFAVQYNR